MVQYSQNTPKELLLVIVYEEAGGSSKLICPVGKCSAVSFPFFNILILCPMLLAGVEGATAIGNMSQQYVEAVCSLLNIEVQHQQCVPTVGPGVYRICLYLLKVCLKKYRFRLKFMVSGF